MAHNDPNDSLDALKKTLEQTNRSVSELTRAMSGLSRARADRFVFKIPDDFVRQVAEGTVSRMGATLRDAGTGRFVKQLRETTPPSPAYRPPSPVYKPPFSAENQKTLDSILKALQNPKPSMPSSVEVQSLFVLGEISSRLGMLVATTKAAVASPKPTPPPPKEYFGKTFLGKIDVFLGDMSRKLGFGGTGPFAGTGGRVRGRRRRSPAGSAVPDFLQGEFGQKIGGVLGSIFKPIDNYLGQVARNIGEDFSRIGEVFQGSVGRKLFGWMSGGSKAAPPTGMPAVPAPPKELQIITLLKEISARLADIASKTGGAGAAGAGKVLGFKELADFVAKAKEIDPQDFIASFLEKVKGTKPAQLPLGADYEKAAAPALPSLFQPQLELERARARNLSEKLGGQLELFGDEDTTRVLKPLPLPRLSSLPTAPTPELMSSPDLLGPLGPVQPTAAGPTPRFSREGLRQALEEARLELAGRLPAPPTGAGHHALAALEKGALAVPPIVQQPILPAEAMPGRVRGEGDEPPEVRAVLESLHPLLEELSGGSGILANPAAVVAPVLRRLRGSQRRRLSRMGPEALAAEGRRHEEALRQQGLWEGSKPATPTFPPAEAFPAPRGEDRIPAMLTEGEAVLTPEQAAELGLGGIETVAGGAIKYLASGTGTTGATGAGGGLGGLGELAIAAAEAAVAIKVVKGVLGGWAESLLRTEKRFDESGAMSVVQSRMEVFEINRNRAIGDELAPSAGGLEESWENLESKLTPYLIQMYEVLNVLVGKITTVAADDIEMGEALIAKAADGFDSLNLTNKKMLALWTDFVRRGEIGDAGAADRFLQDLERDFMDRRNRKGFESGRGAPTIGRPGREFLLPGVPRSFPG